jgi:hypothetical protein
VIQIQVAALTVDFSTPEVGVFDGGIYVDYFNEVDPTLQYQYVRNGTGVLEFNPVGPDAVYVGGTVTPIARVELSLLDVTWGAGQRGLRLAATGYDRQDVPLIVAFGGLTGLDLSELSANGQDALLEYLSLVDTAHRISADRWSGPGQDIPAWRLLGQNTLQHPLVGGPSADEQRGTRGHDVVVGLGGDDLLVGRAGRDTLMCGAGNDTADGGPGADWLSGWLGDDTLTGGPGADVFVFGIQDGADHVGDFDGMDRLRLQRDLWSETHGDLTARQVVRTFAERTDAGVLLTFDQGVSILLADRQWIGDLAAQVYIF